MTPLLSRFLQNNIRASLDKLALRNRGVGQKKISGPLISGDLSVQQLTAFSTLTSLKKVLHKQKPKYLVDKLKINTNTTRQENKITMEASLTVTRGAFFYRAASLYNSLPIEMRNLDPISFKPKVKSWVNANIPSKPR